MDDPRHEKLASVLVRYSTRVRPDDEVLIEAPSLAEPLILAVYRAVLDAGAHPLPRIAVDGVLEDYYALATDDQLDYVNPLRMDEIETCDVRIVLESTWNTRNLATVDPEREARTGRARETLRTRYLERAADGSLRWVLSMFPSDALAQEAEMSLPEYESFVYNAGFLDDDDPVARWETLAEELERVARWFETKTELRIVGDGTDLTIGIGGRHWVAGNGHTNFPDGEVFTGPVENSANGTIRFTYPAVFHGREVHDVRLRFEDGEVVEATAERGEDFLRAMLAMDDGARRIGELAFGLNENVPRFTKNILFDEKIGGTMHLALGTAYPQTGSKNRSALHWDMICDLRGGSDVYADGEVVYRDGKFLAGAVS